MWLCMNFFGVYQLDRKPNKQALMLQKDANSSNFHNVCALWHTCNVLHDSFKLVILIPTVVHRWKSSEASPRAKKLSIT